MSVLLRTVYAAFLIFLLLFDMRFSKQEPFKNRSRNKLTNTVTARALAVSYSRLLRTSSVTLNH